MTTQMIQSLEGQRAVAQLRLDAAKSAAQRNSLGQFSTPLPLAQAIVEQVKKLWLKDHNIRFLDPALGTGVFFSVLRQTFPAAQIQSATGIEIDSVVAEVAMKLWQPLGLQVIQGDFATLPIPPGNKPNLIIANPPYVRHHHLSKKTKALLQNRVKATTNLHLNGLAGLYCYFLLIAHHWLDTGGLGVWLIPSEFMDVNYGDTLKHYLVNEVTLLRIHRFDPQDVQFADALVSSVVLIFRKDKPGDEHKTIFTLGGTLGNPNVSETVPQTQLSNVDKWTSIPGNPLQRVLRDKHKINNSINIGDLFTIRRGIATGANEFFILERNLAHQKNIPAKFLRPILPSPRYLTADEIRADDEGNPLVTPSLVLLDCDLDEENLGQFPPLRDYLALGRSQGYADRYIARHRSPWFRQEHRLIAPILCTYMSRGKSGRSLFRFFRNYSKATAANVYLLLYPKPEILNTCKQDSELLNKLFLLLKEAKEEHLLYEGRTYGGGLNKIEPKELARVQLPDDQFLHTLNLKPKQLLLFER